MKYLALILACGALMLASCSTVKKTATAIPVNNGVYQYPAVADLDIRDKAEGVMTWNFMPFHWGEPPLSVAKSNLVAELLKEKNADVLLEPQFVFEKTSFGERRLTVTGFTATYKNFRNATSDDLEALKVCAPINKHKDYKEDGRIFSRLLGR